VRVPLRQKQFYLALHQRSRNNSSQDNSELWRLSGGQLPSDVHRSERSTRAVPRASGQLPKVFQTTSFSSRNRLNHSLSIHPAIIRRCERRGKPAQRGRKRTASINPRSRRLRVRCAAKFAIDRSSKRGKSFRGFSMGDAISAAPTPAKGAFRSISLAPQIAS